MQTTTLPPGTPSITVKPPTSSAATTDVVKVTTVATAATGYTAGPGQREASSVTVQPTSAVTTTDVVTATTGATDEIGSTEQLEWTYIVIAISVILFLVVIVVVVLLCQWRRSAKKLKKRDQENVLELDSLHSSNSSHSIPVGG